MDCSTLCSCSSTASNLYQLHRPSSVVNALKRVVRNAWVQRRVHFKEWVIYGKVQSRVVRHLMTVERLAIPLACTHITMATRTLL